MNIIIVTLYNSHNSGSYLQAYSLYRILSNQGHVVKFLKRHTKGAHAMSHVIRKMVRSSLKFQFLEAWNNFVKWFVFERALKKLPIVELNSKFYKTADYIILGSDTIWNFDSKYFSNNVSLYLGNTFKDKKIISYAASAANTQLVKFKSVVDQNGGFSNIKTILVRDTHTKKLVEDSYGRTASLVVDPTLLATSSIFLPFIKGNKVNKPYMLLYYFGDLPKDLKQEVLSYSINKGVSIVSMPVHRPWCNHSVISTPQNMVSYFYNAESILTNTFHGTAFSLIYEKPFAVHDLGKNKVEDLLNVYGELDRLSKDPKELCLLLSKKSSASLAERKEILRKESLSLLNVAISNSATY